MTSGVTRLDLDLVAEGFSFVEGPRWHDGAIYVTHIHDDAIDRVDLDGTVRRVVDLPGTPISTAFTSDGTMLVSAMSAQRIWAVDDGEITEHADLSDLSDDHWGDLVIDQHDRVYVANQGMAWPEHMPALEEWNSTIYLLVSGEAPRLVADGFRYANGLAITPDGKWLVVAESFGHRLWRAPIQADGSVGPRELIIELGDEHRPDGICCDAEAAVWSADATSHSVIRCTLDGEMTHEVSTGDALAIGCILGGDDGRDLFVTTAPTAHRDDARRLRSAAVWRTRVDIPAGGRP